MRGPVIEDEQKVARALREGLEGEHYQVEVSATGEDGFFRAVSQSFDVIILDLMLPGRSGLEILNTLRRQGHRTPVLVLTAKDAIQDRVIGLDSGADDYLVKPFAFAELVARLRALIRRGRPWKRYGSGADLEMDLVSRKAARAGETIELTAREYDLLEYLFRHEGEVVSREMLTRDVWKEPSRGTPLDNVIDVHIARVRKKVDAEGRVKLIHTYAEWVSCWRRVNPERSLATEHVRLRLAVWCRGGGARRARLCRRRVRLRQPRLPGAARLSAARRLRDRRTAARGQGIETGCMARTVGAPRRWR